MRFITLLALLLAVAACDPIVMIPGGELSGNVVPVPDDWAFTDAVETVQLETRPMDPYSVNVWVVALEDGVFVVAGSGLETAWAQHIAIDDRVRLRVGDSIYELRGTPDDAQATRDAFLAAAKNKYDFDPESEDLTKAILYRLEAR
jgi:hypothetical protein